jgi:hypothetical protein
MSKVGSKRLTTLRMKDWRRRAAAERQRRETEKSRSEAKRPTAHASMMGIGEFLPGQRRLGGFLPLLPPQPDKPLKESHRVWDSAWSSGKQMAQIVQLLEYSWRSISGISMHARVCEARRGGRAGR